MSLYRIYMDELDDLPGGWYGKPPGVGYSNQQIYWRVDSKADALRFDQRQTILMVRGMRDKGYPCHAVPPIVINETI